MAHTDSLIASMHMSSMSLGACVHLIRVLSFVEHSKNLWRISLISSYCDECVQRQT